MSQPTHMGSMELGQLQQLISDGSPAALEAGVGVGVQILKDTRAAFTDARTLPEIAEWIKSSNQLEDKSNGQRAVVGVVGSTGAGKSSVINAVLDEECLVPTSCMRACTAVITEIAYNNSTVEDEKYRAEIHFISKAEWTRELRVILADMDIGQTLLGPDSIGTESDAAIAYHKIRSVYPFLTHEEVSKGNFDFKGLANHPSVKDLIGNVKHLASSNSQEFLAGLAAFIDSKDKKGDVKQESDTMEFWPLIKVVKVFVKSRILETGLVLVDLVCVAMSDPRFSGSPVSLTGGTAWFP